MMKIQFLGATRTVTGSRFLVEQNNFRVLVDCGLFQGQREWKQRNWSDFPVAPASVDCVVLTHAHIDHAGYLPRFIRLGFRGPVYCTPATAELLSLMLPDSGHLQEEDAEWANRKKYGHHDPALPLYTEEEAREALHALRPVDFYTRLELSPGLAFSYLRAGHILGSGMVQFRNEDRVVTFSGDLGRPAQFITKEPDNLESTDCLVLESTYGNRLHQRIDVKEHLAELVRNTVGAGGSVVVPAFAIGRTQELLYILRILEESGKIPHVPVFIDSPMAIHALPIYERHQIDFSKELKELSQKDSTPFISPNIRVLQTVQESMSLNKINYPSIIISSSGMATGGRVLHHLKHKIGDHRNTVLFIGFQAQGTKGRFLVEGATEIKLFGQTYPVKAKIEYMDALSCHADYEEILDWLQSVQKTPEHVYLVHGEESASLSLAEKIRGRFKWNVEVPQYQETVEV